jgi:hypothetical protein
MEDVCPKKYLNRYVYPRGRTPLIPVFDFERRDGKVFYKTHVYLE